MPRMSKKRKQEWALFLNERNRITYNELCRRCQHDCKQSFRVTVIGDSPIFRFDEGTIQKISTDHIQENYLNGKPPLTQFLGVPESDFIIQPYIAKGNYKLGNKYLICSDGLTDMVDIDTIKKIVDSSSTEIATQTLLDVALENGGKDNITIILCEIIKEKILFNRKEQKR